MTQILQLKKWDKADIASEVQEYLRRISNELTFPLTAQNLPRLISDITLNELGYELESKLLAGENVNNYTPCHYFSIKITDIYRDWETDRKSTRLNSSHLKLSRMPSSA